MITFSFQQKPIWPQDPPPHHDYIQFSTKTHLLFTLNPIECGGMTLLHQRWIAKGGKTKTSPFVHEIIKVFFFFFDKSEIIKVEKIKNFNF